MVQKLITNILRLLDDPEFNRLRKKLHNLSRGTLFFPGGPQEAALFPDNEVIAYFHKLWDECILRAQTTHPELYRFFRNQGSFQKVFPLNYDSVIWHATNQFGDINFCREASFLALQIIDHPLSPLERQNFEPILDLAYEISNSFAYDEPDFYPLVHDQEEDSSYLRNF